MTAKKKKLKETFGWHFLRSNKKLNYDDGRVVVEGETLSVKCKPQLCNAGMHASFTILDAMSYEVGPVLCRVAVSGNVDKGYSKFCGKHRRVIWMRELTKKDLKRCCKELNFEVKSSSASATSLMGLISSYGDNNNAESWMVNWALDNGLRYLDGAPAKHKLGLPKPNENDIKNVLILRMVFTAKEIKDKLALLKKFDVTSICKYGDNPVTEILNNLDFKYSDIAVIENYYTNKSGHKHSGYTLRHKVPRSRHQHK